MLLDNRPLRLKFGGDLPKVLLYHKQEGEICTRDDPEGRPTVFDKLPRVHGGRWVAVGRLDFNTSGLLVFTTDGELANNLMHPRFEVEREYAVRLLGELTAEQHQQLLNGVMVDDELCKFEALEDRGGEGSNHWYHVILREGKNREVRKMFEAVNMAVSRLMRVRFGQITLPPRLKRGMMMELPEEEVEQILSGRREEGGAGARRARQRSRHGRRIRRVRRAPAQRQRHRAAFRRARPVAAAGQARRRQIALPQPQAQACGLR